MRKHNILRDKSFAYAVRVVNLYKHLSATKQEFVISKQLLRSGTSVGSMLRESEYAESKADFVHKMAIAQKEINESLYWQELLKETEYLENKEFESLNENAIELLKLITASIKTAKKQLK